MHPVILLLLSSITTDWVWLLIFTRFLDHTQRCTTVGKTPLNEWSVRRRDLYLTTHNNHNKHPCPPTCWGFLFTLKNPTASAGFEPANVGTKGQHATSRPPKQLRCILTLVNAQYSMIIISSYFNIVYIIIGDRCETVVKVLCHKSERCWFDPRWYLWNFSLT